MGEGERRETGKETSALASQKESSACQKGRIAVLASKTHERALPKACPLYTSEDLHVKHLSIL